MERRYFITNLPNENVIHALDVCIGRNDTQRYSLDGSQLIVKTNQPLLDSKINEGIGMDTILPPGLTTEYTIDPDNNILPNLHLVLAGPEWTDPDAFL